MNPDIASYLGTTTRVVHDRERDGAPVKVVAASRTYDTTVEDLWDAVTTRERIERWFVPVTGELRLGGRYQIQGNAGGTVTTCEPPRHFALTWEFAGATSWVDVTLSARGQGAHLALEHTFLPDDHWKKFGAGATGVGWDSMLLGLYLYVVTGAGMTPEEGMRWLGSDEGKAFVRASSDGWRDAAITGGAPAAEATAQGVQTIAAYTGEPADGETGAAT
jgi:uncharacterized protein YndB with AHSA1/START domain